MGIIDWVKRNILGITYEQIAREKLRKQDAADYTPRYLTGHDRSTDKFLEAAQKVADAQDVQQGTVIFAVQQVPAKPKEPRSTRKAATEVKQYLPDITKMTKRELREFAEGKGIEIDGRNKKAKILEDIQKALK